MRGRSGIPRRWPSGLDAIRRLNSGAKRPEDENALGRRSDWFKASGSIRGGPEGDPRGGRHLSGVTGCASSIVPSNRRQRGGGQQQSTMATIGDNRRQSIDNRRQSSFLPTCHHPTAATRRRTPGSRSRRRARGRFRCPTFRGLERIVTRRPRPRTADLSGSHRRIHARRRGRGSSALDPASTHFSR